MFDFLKTFGQGLLYLVLSPFILLMVVLYTIYSFFVFFFMFFKRIFLFFGGYDMKEEMKIDRIAKFHIDQQDEEEEVKKAVQPTPIIEKNNTTVVQPIIIQTDQNGILKSVQVGQITNNNEAPKQIEEVVESIESHEEENVENDYLEEEEEDEYDY